MSVVDDARDIFRAFGESPQGSYLEATLALSIARDILPALINHIDNPPKPFGFAAEIRELVTETELTNNES